MKRTPHEKGFFAMDEQRVHEEGLRRKRLDDKRMDRARMAGGSVPSTLRRGVKARERK